MSSLLGEAIVDAKALRESALKNAESAIIEKYSEEVKKTLENLLEQEEEGLDLGADMAMDAGAPLEETEDAEPVTEDDVPFAATDGLSENEGENLSKLPHAGEDVEINIDLGALQESIRALGDSVDEEVDIEFSLEEDSKPDFLDLDDDGDTDEPMKKAAADKKETNEEMAVTIDDEAAEEEADSKAMAGLANLDEDEFDASSLVDAVMEKLNVDMGFELSGWAGRPTSQLKLGQERELARETSTPSETTDEEVELDSQLKESVANLENENNSLKDELDKYKHAVEQIKENLYEVNLSNARLLYTNRVLRNTSLNERQKDKIVEAISSAGSVAEAKTIYETLQSTVEAKPKKSPQSLSEAIGRRSSVIRATRKESSQPNDVFSDRMRRLAGIKS
tara:strand:- start:211 stop:1392 length:1182 start_codon:yes stop_codon:yes gene_type:complete